MSEPGAAGRAGRALVTGASRGIGEAIVRMLLEKGYGVDALALDDPDLARLATETGARPLAVDVRDTPALAAALTGTAYDVVVNNAGILPELEPFPTAEPSGIDRLLDVNLRAALHVTRLVLPAMLERDRGHLVFTGSVAGRRPTAKTAVYSATKAAIDAFADGLRLDLTGSRVRVTVLRPGRVRTNLYDGVFGGSEAAAAALYADVEAIAPTDIAAVVGFALDLPEHVDVTTLEVVPTGQVFGGSAMAPLGPRTET